MLSRLTWLDRLLLLTLVPLWGVCFGLSLKSALLNTPFSPIYVSAAQDARGYPRVAGFERWLGGGESGLRVGDRLIEMGRADLRGVGAIGFSVQLAEQTGPDRTVAVVFERAGERRRISLPVASYSFAWPFLPASLGFLLTSLVLLVRVRQPPPSARAILWACMCSAVAFAANFGGSPMETYAGVGVRLASLACICPLALRAALLYPHDVPPTSRLAALGPWGLVALSPLQTSAAYGWPLTPDAGRAGVSVLLITFFATVILVTTRTYRRSDPVGRRQLKWIMYGVYCAFVPPMAASAATVALARPSSPAGAHASYACLVIR